MCDRCGIMNIKEFLDFEEIAEHAGLNSSYEDYCVDYDDCFIQAGNDGIEIVIVMGIDNGCHGNDPSWEGATWTITLDENLDEIESIHEVQ